MGADKRGASSSVGAAGAPTRWAWSVLASIVIGVAAVGVAAGSIREYQMSSCEIVDTTATCMMSTLDIVGWGATVVVVVAALFCVVPALWPRPVVRWGSVAVLVALGAGSLIVLGRIGLGVLAVAALATVLAAVQGRPGSRGGLRVRLRGKEVQVPLRTLMGRSVGPSDADRRS